MRQKKKEDRTKVREREGWGEKIGRKSEREGWGEKDRTKVREGGVGRER